MRCGALGLESRFDKMWCFRVGVKVSMRCGALGLESRFNEMCCFRVGVKVQ